MEIKKIEFINPNLNGVAEIFAKHILVKLNNNIEEVGYIELDFRGYKKINLEAIYCTDEYRRCGIGTTLLDISDTLLKNYTGYTLCGEYFPSQAFNDICILRTREELDKAARSFYLKHGFKITKYKDYIANPSVYPEIHDYDFNTKNREFGRSVVYKKINQKDKYRFVDIEDAIIEDSAYKIRGSI